MPRQVLSASRPVQKKIAWKRSTYGQAPSHTDRTDRAVLHAWIARRGRARVARRAGDCRAASTSAACVSTAATSCASRTGRRNPGCRRRREYRSCDHAAGAERSARSRRPASTPRGGRAPPTSWPCRGCRACRASAHTRSATGGNSRGRCPATTLTSRDRTGCRSAAAGAVAATLATTGRSGGA